MIHLKQLLKELSEPEISVYLDKIKNKDFKFIGRGDNGRVYKINGEDKVFKVTTERDEYEVAAIIAGRWSEFTTFIPVYYVNNKEHMFIMANAELASERIQVDINSFMDRFKQFSRNEGGEVSIFDFLDGDGARSTPPEIVNFLRALQRDVAKLNIPEFDLDLDFSSHNVMTWNNKLVLVDW